VITRATAARRDPFLRTVTAEVINLQVVTLAAWILIALAAAAGWNLAALGVWLLWLPVAVYSYVVGAIGAIRAWRAEAWRYPMNLSLIPGRPAA
jgi:uncharacterized Tic20 family protein